MRRLLLLMAVAAMMLALVAAPALGAAREPTSFNGPGQASEELSDLQQHPNKATPTPSAGSNCYGQLTSNSDKGPRGNPGSLAVPTDFGGPNYTGHAVSTLDPVGPSISGFQQDFRDEAAGQSC
jgi:hypothetical protein